MRIDSERAREIQITLVEGFQLLGSFDVRLREYAARSLHKQGVHLIKARACTAQAPFGVLLDTSWLCAPWIHACTEGLCRQKPLICLVEAAKGVLYRCFLTQSCVMSTTTVKLCRAW